MSQGGLGTDGWQESVPEALQRRTGDFVAELFSGPLAAALRAHAPARMLLDGTREHKALRT